MPDPTSLYFDLVIARAPRAPVVPRVEWASALPNKCHENCEAYVAGVEGFEVVRGWLVLGGNFCIPHSVVRNKATEALVDITPDPSNSLIPFVEHTRSERDFQILRQGRDGGWLHSSVQGPSAGFDTVDRT